MSTEAVFLYDPTIPALEKEGENPNRMRFSVPTKVTDALGTGTLDIQKGTLTLRAIAMVRRCTVIKGLAYTAEEEPQDGILLDGGITIVDTTGQQRTIANRIWTLTEETDSTLPDDILKNLIMGKSKDFAERVTMIAEGYTLQENKRRERIKDGIDKALGDAREARDGTFGRRY